MGTVITRMCKKIESVKAMPKTKDFLMLAYDPSPWKSQIYMTVTRTCLVAGREAFGNIPRKVLRGLIRMFRSGSRRWKSTNIRGQDCKEAVLLLHDLPKCAKKYGKNYVVAFAQV
jgi:hypothetical protein